MVVREDEKVMATWGMAKAKAQLSEVVYEAEKTGPQTLSRSGREVAVVISMKEWEELRKPDVKIVPGESMADFFMNSPLRGSGLKIPKLNWKMRKIDL